MQWDINLDSDKIELNNQDRDTIFYKIILRQPTITTAFAVLGEVEYKKYKNIKIEMEIWGGINFPGNAGCVELIEKGLPTSKIFNDRLEPVPDLKTNATHEINNYIKYYLIDNENELVRILSILFAGKMITSSAHYALLKFSQTQFAGFKAIEARNKMSLFAEVDSQSPQPHSFDYSRTSKMN